jgi:hypothetical protein
MKMTAKYRRKLMLRATEDRQLATQLIQEIGVDATVVLLQALASTGDRDGCYVAAALARKLPPGLAVGGMQ